MDHNDEILIYHNHDPKKSIITVYGFITMLINLSFGSLWAQAGPPSTKARDSAMTNGS
jgi:hypothetical protein